MGPAGREPDPFGVAAERTGLLTGAGGGVLVLPEYEDLAKAPNRHLPGRSGAPS